MIPMIPMIPVFSGRPNREHPHMYLPLDRCGKEHTPHAAWYSWYADADCDECAEWDVLAIAFFGRGNDSS